MDQKFPVAVLGANGSVGQRFVQLLHNHPFFEVTALTGSTRSEGRTYREACHWILQEPMPEWAAEMVLLPSMPEKNDWAVAFSALPADIAKEVEPFFATAGTVVCSNASAYRSAPDVPILMPEVNPEHAGLLQVQRRNRGWKGGIATNSNCTSTGLTIALKALEDVFGVDKAMVVSMQAVSGAGYPGVPSLDILGNVIPYIGGSEEEKVEWEPRKMMGRLVDDHIEPAGFVLSAHTNRVAVRDGHMVCLSVELKKKPSIEEVKNALRSYQAPEVSRSLPSAPRPVIDLREEPDRPQPILDSLAGRGMTTSVGRVRPDPIMDYKMVILSHNTIRGAAGGSIYNAELLAETGLIR
ncbi:MAG: aspartate-semialdehyde dehydrogenase [Anaerolineaceae bacterium]